MRKIKENKKKIHLQAGQTSLVRDLRREWKAFVKSGRCRQWLGEGGGGCGGGGVGGAWLRKSHQTARCLIGQHSADAWGLNAGFTRLRKFSGQTRLFCVSGHTGRWRSSCCGAGWLQELLRRLGSRPARSLVPWTTATKGEQKTRKRNEQKYLSVKLFFLKKKKKGYIHIDINVKFKMYKSSITLQSGGKKITVFALCTLAAKKTTKKPNE